MQSNRFLPKMMHNDDTSTPKLVDVPSPADLAESSLHGFEAPQAPPTGPVQSARWDERDTCFGPDSGQVSEVLNRLGVDWLSAIQRDIMYTNWRLKLVAGGERAGKSFISGTFGATRTPFGKLFWIVGPDYELARPEFDYWIEHLARLDAFRSERDISRPKIGKASAITKTGQIIETKTADEVMKIAAKAPDGIIMSEAAQQSLESFMKCIGRVAEKRGWLLLSGTFEGSEGWYAERFREWERAGPDNIEGGKSYSMPSWSNLLIYPGGRNDPEILRMEQIYGRVPGMFEERLGATPIPPTNLVFREFRSSIHVSELARYDPSRPVYLAVDPSDGTNPYSVLACQFETHVRQNPSPDPIDYCNIIDELYLTGKIVDDIVDIVKQRPWWSSVRGGAIDVEAPDERRRWHRHGGILLHSEKIHVLSGIRRLKSFLHYKWDEKAGVMIEAPHLRIAPRVESLPYEFRKYKKSRVEDLDGDIQLKEIPAQSQADHSLKALWYLLIARYGEVKAVARFKPAYNWIRGMKYGHRGN